MCAIYMEDKNQPPDAHYLSTYTIGARFFFRLDLSPTSSDTFWLHHNLSFPFPLGFLKHMTFLMIFIRCAQEPHTARGPHEALWLPACLTTTYCFTTSIVTATCLTPMLVNLVGTKVFFISLTWLFTFLFPDTITRAKFGRMNSWLKQMFPQYSRLFWEKRLGTPDLYARARSICRLKCNIYARKSAIWVLNSKISADLTVKFNICSNMKNRGVNCRRHVKRGNLQFMYGRLIRSLRVGAGSKERGRSLGGRSSAANTSVVICMQGQSELALILNKNSNSRSERQDFLLTL